MKLTITIESGNAAFEGADCVPECTRILKGVISAIQGNAHQGAAAKLRDINGNVVGSFDFSGADEEEA